MAEKAVLGKPIEERFLNNLQCTPAFKVRMLVTYVRVFQMAGDTHSCSDTSPGVGQLAYVVTRKAYMTLIQF